MCRRVRPTGTCFPSSAARLGKARLASAVTTFSYAFGLGPNAFSALSLLFPLVWEREAHAHRPSSGPDPTSRAENPSLGLFSYSPPHSPQNLSLAPPHPASPPLHASCPTFCPSGSLLNLVTNPLWNPPRRGPMTFTEAPRDVVGEECGRP